MGKIVVFDIEANGLNPDRIHCLSVKGKKLKSTASYDNMRSFFDKAEVLVGHNIVRYDIPVVERILGVKPKAKLVDTLALSWYLYPDRIKHGLEDWGEYFGIPKPVVKDWEGLSTEEYIHRCEEDVKINTKLWNKMWAHLKKLYGSEEEAWRFIEYLTFKMECARKQEELRWKLDVPLCERNLKELEKLKEEKVIALIEAMPKVPKYAKKSKPKTMYKIDGSLSVHGKKWFDLLAEQKLPEDYDGDVRYVQSYEEPKPTSSVQIKSWLVSLGWVPQTFKYKRDKETNEFTQIPQVNLENGKGICPSIKKLYDKEPSLELLDGLSVLTHRISLLRGFLDAVDEEGYVKAQIQGLTNTLRFKHKVVVNLPGVDKPYGGYIRGCLTAPTGYQLVGSDMSSLEDRTKQHYMWDFDPDYVTEMNVEGFDPHLDIAALSGMMTQKQVDDFKGGDKSLNHIRHAAKQVNYSCTYGVTPKGLVRNTGMPIDEATTLHTTYWKRNWSIQAIADSCKVKTVNGQKWLYNPVSRFWYSLRAEKDRFSTLNQGTGVYCFDKWVSYLLEKNFPICAQMHDEVCAAIRIGKEEKAKKVLRWAIEKTNEELKLNRRLDISIEFGNNYADVH